MRKRYITDPGWKLMPWGADGKNGLVEWHLDSGDVCPPPPCVAACMASLHAAERPCMCVCAWVRVSVQGSGRVHVRACMRAREREHEHVCVCMRARVHMLGCNLF